MLTHERGRAPTEKDEARLTVPGSLPGLSRNKTQAPILAQAAGGAKRCDALERHILHCERAWQDAYARFEQRGDPMDRKDALAWLYRMNKAILKRPADVQARRHAAFEARVVLRDAELVRGALVAEGIMS